MNCDGVISSDEYLTILVKFPKSIFQISNCLQYYFDYYYHMEKMMLLNMVIRRVFLNI